MRCNLGGCHGISRECCMADDCIYCDEHCGGKRPKPMSPTKAEKMQADHERFKDEAHKINLYIDRVWKEHQHLNDYSPETRARIAFGVGFHAGLLWDRQAFLSESVNGKETT